MTEQPRPRWSVRLAWSGAAAAVALAALDLVFVVLINGTPTPFGTGSLSTLQAFAGVVVGTLGFAGVGVLVASRYPANLVGWLFLAAGLVLGLISFTSDYPIWALTVRPGGRQA